MAFKKDANGNPIISPKQKVVLLYGQRLRGLGSVSELQRHLKELGYPEAALQVGGAVLVLKSAAQQEYKRNRLDLDHEWESPFDKIIRELDQQDQVMQ